MKQEAGIYINMFKKAQLWFDDSTAIYQEQFPIIRNLPPINSGMPFEVMMSYIYLDSLLKYGNDSLLSYYDSQWTTVNDTLKGALKYMHVLADYNPIILKQYEGEVKLHQKFEEGLKIGDFIPGDSINPNYPKKYDLDLYLLKERAGYKFRELYSQNDMLAMFSIFMADYILKVQIQSIDSVWDNTTSPGYYRYIVNATLLDTLKGKEFPTRSILPNSLIETNFKFQYTQLLYMMFGQYNCSFQYPDPILSDNGKFRLLPGQTAVIFLDYRNQLYDYNFDYFDLGLSSRCSMGALGIQDGMIQDLNHIWSNNDTISYDEWKQIYLNIVNKILTLNY